MMKIVLATASFGGGGITSYALELINSYSKGNQLSVIIGDDSKEPITNQEVKKYQCDCNDLTITNALKLVSIINNDIKPDLIIASYAPLINVVSPFLSDSIKIITVSHSLRFFESEYSVINHKYIDKVIAASSIYNKSFLEKRYHIKDKNKIDVIYNFVAELNQSEKIINEKKQNRPLKIVFAGASSPAKSPDLVLKIIHRLVKTEVPFEFYWMGRTHIHMSQHFPFLGLNEISDLGPNDHRIKYVGRLPRREDANQLIASANIFLAPSRREGCPIALIEAMRTGAIPVCADFENANKDIVQNKINGFVVSSKDVDGFVELLETMCKNPERFEGFYKASYCRYKDTLTYSIWKKNMDFALYHCPTGHDVRKKKVTKSALLYQIIKMNLVKVRCWCDNIFGEELPTLLELYKIKKKYGTRTK